MRVDTTGPGVMPARYAPPPVQVAAVTQRDMVAAARLGVQAAPVRNIDPVTGAGKRERAGETLSDKRADADRARLDMLRFAALRRDVAAITGR